MPARTIDKLPEPRKAPPAPVRAVPAVAPRPAAMAPPAAVIAPSTALSNGVATHRSADAAAPTASPASARSARPTAATAGTQHGPPAASPAASSPPRRGSAPRPTSAIDLQGAAQFIPGAWTEYIQSCAGWADVLHAPFAATGADVVTL